MFDFVRTHTRLFQLMLFLLVFPSFVFFGVQGYSRFSEAGMRAVASVDGQTITQGDWDLAHQRWLDQTRRQMPGVDAKMFDTPQARQETLDNLLRERV
ncbi:MAG: SurA N-terminal domain-containing protein, partial [bacterium]